MIVFKKLARLVEIIILYINKKIFLSVTPKFLMIAPKFIIYFQKYLKFNNKNILIIIIKIILILSYINYY